MLRNLGETLTALLFVAMGLLIELIAFGVVRTQLHAPRFVVACAGLAFAGGGLALLLRNRARLGRAASASVVFGLGCVFGWCALHPEKGRMTAPPWVPEGIARLILQIAAGSASLFCLAMALWLLVQLFRRRVDAG